MIFKKNIPMAQETLSLTSLGPFLVFDALVVVVRRETAVLLVLAFVTILLLIHFL
jgi:hypothetical protein